MHEVQIESVEEPFLSHPDLAGAAFKLLHKAQFVGVCPRTRKQRALGPDLITAFAEEAGGGGLQVMAIEVKDLGGKVARKDAPENDLQRYLRLLKKLQDGVEASPRPKDEWEPVLRTLGEDLVSGLVGTSPSSLRRYSTGTRTTPQKVAERLHFVALILGELAGSYNDYGMRRWFTRPRVSLDGRAPADFMGRDFDPDGPVAQRIRELAESVATA